MSSAGNRGQEIRGPANLTARGPLCPALQDEPAVTPICSKREEPEMLLGLFHSLQVSSASLWLRVGAESPYHFHIPQGSPPQQQQRPQSSPFLLLPNDSPGRGDHQPEAVSSVCLSVSQTPSQSVQRTIVMVVVTTGLRVARG